LVRLIVETDIFDLITSAKISTTLGISRPGEQLNPQNVLTISTLRSANIKGKPEPREKFFVVWSILFQKFGDAVSGEKNLPSFIITLLRLTTENDVLDSEGYDKLTVVFGIKDVVVPNPKIPKNVLNLKISGRTDAAITFLDALDELFGGNKPTDGSLEAKIPEVDRLVIQLLVDNELFNPTTNTKLLTTFGITGPKDVVTRKTF